MRPAIASKYLEASIPFIAIDIPHPGATYFGANNYQAGLMAGHYLGRWAKKHWNGEPDEILLVELHRAGSLPQARIRGVQSGIGEVLRVPERCRIVSVDGDGQFQTTLERVRKHLRESKAKRVLVGAVNDSSALGALRAYEEAGRASECVIVGQNAEPEARAELRSREYASDRECGVLPGEVRGRPVEAGTGYACPARRCRPPCSPRTSSSLRKTWITSTRTTACLKAPA